MKEHISIWHRLLDSSSGTFIIAEIAGAHEGSLERALRLIEDAKNAGADAVKFQKFSAEKLVLKDNKYFNSLKKNELSVDAWKEIAIKVKEANLKFIVDIFDSESLKFLELIGVDAYKIHTTDINNLDLIAEVVKTKKPILLASGGAELSELNKAVNIILEFHSKIIIMYGFQAYPTKIEDSHLNALKFLSEKFGFELGFIDHTDASLDISKILPAVSLGFGVKVIEKHITIDRDKKPCDYESALEKKDFADFVRIIREVEKAFGENELSLSGKEKEYAEQVKKRVISSRHMAKGEIMKKQDLKFCRASKGLFLSDLGKILGRKVIKEIKKGDFIERSNLEESKVVAVLACRVNSMRLKSKPLQILEGKTILEHIIDRLAISSYIDENILAISAEKENKVFEDFAKKFSLKYFYGSDEDVLERIYESAKKVNAKHVVRVTTENPLIYTEKLDDLIYSHLTQKADFSYYSDLPLGCIVEIISISAIQKSIENGEKKHHSELVTSYINDNKEKFVINELKPPKNVRGDFRLTVDTEDDLRLLKLIYSEFYRQNKFVRLGEVISFLKNNPEIANMNRNMAVGTSRIWN